MTLFDVDTVQKTVMNNIVSVSNNKEDDTSDEGLTFGKKKVKNKLNFTENEDE